MLIKKFAIILFVSLTFTLVFPQQSYASLSTRIRICAVKGTVQTGPAISGGHQGNLYTCPLKQTLDQTECKVVNVATMVKTGHDGFAIIEYQDGTKLKMAPDTKLVLSQNNIYIETGKTWFKVEKQNNGKQIVKTPTAIAGIRGTEFLVNVQDNGTTNIQLLKGNIEVSDINHHSTIDLSAGMEVKIVAKSSVLDTKLLKINPDNKWWTNWPTLMPITEKPGYSGGITGNTNGGQQIPASADAYVYAYAYRNWNQSNRGKYEQLVAGWHPTGGESRIYIRFDLDGVRPSSVHHAILRLYHTGTYGNNGIKLGVYRVTDPWVEGQDTYHPGQVEKTADQGVLSWMQQPVFNNSIIATFNPGMEKDNWVEVDITPLVKQWMAGFQNNGLLIKPVGNMDKTTPESVYHFASRETTDKNHWPVLILDGATVSDSSTSSPSNLNKTAIILDATRWQPHSNGTSVCNVVNNSLCIRSQQVGGAWFTTQRPYGFEKDYSVSFDIKLNTADNHFPVLYSDGFVFVDVDWGTTLGHYQPGLSYNLKQLENLAVNQWYHIRIDAYPSKRSFNIYLDGRLVSKATNIQPLHSYYTLTPQIHRKDIIWFGDADSQVLKGGQYNHGDVCWRNIRVNWGNNVSETKSSVEDVWTINQSDQIFRWNGRNWTNIPGLATDVGVGAHGTVWIIGKQKVSDSYDIERWTGTQFVKVSGGAVRMDVGPWGTPWVVNESGDIFYRKNKVWKQIPGKATDIGVGADGTVWIIGSKAVYGGFEIFKWTGTAFVKIPGAAVRIDVDPNGNPWVVNAFGNIYRWKNNKWENLPGLAKDISVGTKGSVWIIGTNAIEGGYGIYRWNKNNNNWDMIPGGATTISVGGMHTGEI